MKKILYTVRTTDGTVGTICQEREPYENETIVIHCYDENGNGQWLTKKFDFIIDEEEA